MPDCVRRVAEHLVNVQIDDMRRGVHEHLEFGTGEIDFPPVLRRAGRRRLRRAGRRRAAAALARRARPWPPARWTSCVAAASRRRSGGARMHPAQGARMTRTTAGRAEAYPIRDWLEDARCAAVAARARRDRRGRFPAAARRKCGRGAAGPAPPGWTRRRGGAGAAAAALPAGQAADRPASSTATATPPRSAAVLKRAAALPSATAACRCCDDAIRTNDTRLVAAALGPYARHLDSARLAAGGAQVRVHRRAARARSTAWPTAPTPNWPPMLAAFAAERVRRRPAMPADAAALLAGWHAPTDRRRDMRIFDPHIHMTSRTTDDYERDGRRRASAPSSSPRSGSGSRARAPARSSTTSTRCSAGSPSAPRSSASATTARSA